MWTVVICFTSSRKNGFQIAKCWSNVGHRHQEIGRGSLIEFWIWLVIKVFLFFQKENQELNTTPPVFSYLMFFSPQLHFLLLCLSSQVWPATLLCTFFLLFFSIILLLHFLLFLDFFHKPLPRLFMLMNTLSNLARTTRLLTYLHLLHSRFL